MNLHDNDLEVMQVARKLLSVFQGITVGFLKKKDQDDAVMAGLRDKITDLQAEISQVAEGRGKAAGTDSKQIERLNQFADENRELQEEIEKLKKALSQKEGQSSEVSVSESKGKGSVSGMDLSRDLSFYYNDFKKIDQKHLSQEDAEGLYNLADYIFKVLKKNKINF
jgi:uncharacterized phage infection (PIP) family protein YhgE